MAKAKKPLSKRDRFVVEYQKDRNATQAAIRAGYSPRTAGSQASRLLRDVNIAAQVVEKQEAIQQQAIVDATYVLTSLKNIAERCQQAEPVLDRDGEPTGEYRFDAAGANRAVELLGKTMGLFTDKLKIDLADLREKSDAELEAEAKALGL